MIKETHKHDKTSNRLLRKLMTEPKQDNRIAKIKRDINEEYAREILGAMADVRNGG